jgi:hypothetical protein
MHSEDILSLVKSEYLTRLDPVTINTYEQYLKRCFDRSLETFCPTDKLNYYVIAVVFWFLYSSHSRLLYCWLLLIEDRQKHGLDSIKGSGHIMNIIGEHLDIKIQEGPSIENFFGLTYERIFSLPRVSYRKVILKHLIQPFTNVIATSDNRLLKNKVYCPYGYILSTLDNSSILTRDSHFSKINNILDAIIPDVEAEIPQHNLFKKLIKIVCDEYLESFLRADMTFEKTFKRKKIKRLILSGENAPIQLYSVHAALRSGAKIDFTNHGVSISKNPFLTKLGIKSHHISI